MKQQKGEETPTTDQRELEMTKWMFSGDFERTSDQQAKNLHHLVMKVRHMTTNTHEEKLFFCQ